MQGQLCLENDGSRTDISEKTFAVASPKAVNYMELRVASKVLHPLLAAQARSSTASEEVLPLPLTMNCSSVRLLLEEPSRPSRCLALVLKPTTQVTCFNRRYLYSQAKERASTARAIT
jgi:hypothetical protein